MRHGQFRWRNFEPGFEALASSKAVELFDVGDEQDPDGDEHIARSLLRYPFTAAPEPLTVIAELPFTWAADPFAAAVAPLACAAYPLTPAAARSFGERLIAAADEALP